MPPAPLRALLRIRLCELGQVSFGRFGGEQTNQGFGSESEQVPGHELKSHPKKVNLMAS